MDRLSELPDSVIFHIFWLLPMWEVVRTTILSKRWLNLWTITPFLNFDETDSSFDTTEQFRNSVQRPLLRWDGVKVLKFKVDTGENKSINGDVDLWVRFAKKYEVEELYLHRVIDEIFWADDGEHNVYWVPQYLYSCSSLKVLSITNCYFRIKGNVQWNHLKSLTIVDGFGVTEHVINQILCGSPRLEVLIMSLLECGKSLVIRSASLKELLIYRYLDSYSDESYSTAELRIWTPNLERLDVKGLPYRKCLFMNVSSLIHATLGFSCLHEFDEKYCDDLSGIDGSLPTSHFLGDLFGQILPSIKHVENVTLVSCCFKVLGAMIERCMNSSSPNVKSLRQRFHCSKFVGMIEISPLLKKLFIEVGECVPSYDYRDSLRTDSNVYLQLEKNLPMSFVLELRKVEVTLVEGDILFPFLEFLLKNASKLEKIVFRVKRTMSPSHHSNSLRLASKRLLRMPRSSLAARFTFSEY
ncbi:F-box/LRR-repeat protein At3g26922-like isoform X2 [Salvia miltiorrhiza]|uniref:F-box/LRR-repeat protein At3g26922-like isoform X2 n=1 Tax=Salvia miltiorrhiza TaxID=226208 RepID=UPI0025AD435E|nr:F-box/LRR-repeat protein At3g26922-like isoform X2 [Salvia miltiorrhiza]